MKEWLSSFFNKESDDSEEPETEQTSVSDWLVSVFIKAIDNISSEQDRLELLTWLALARETLADESLSKIETFTRLYSLIDFKKSIGAVFNGVSEAVKNYASSDLPLAVKITLPVTLAAATVVGGQSIGIAGFGSAIGMPVLLLIFIGVAGITAILQAFLGDDGADGYVGVVLALIARDEVLRRTKAELREAMKTAVVAPKKQAVSEDGEVLRAELLAMSPFDFECHVMAFFQDQGMLAWVTKQSNDAGVDGFARHANGLIVVQCKRNASDNAVGRPIVQQFKGVVEENSAYRGYVVTTSYFTDGAVESAALNDRLVLVDMSGLVAWHSSDGPL